MPVASASAARSAGIQSVTVGGGFSGVAVSTVVVGGAQTVMVGSNSGPVTITGSAASGNYTVGDNASLSDSSISPGDVTITGTTGDIIVVTSPSLGSLSVDTPSGNSITVQGPLTVTNGDVTITSGASATIMVQGGVTLNNGGVSITSGTAHGAGGQRHGR